MRVSRAMVRMLGGGLLLALLIATPAGAHDPIFVDERTVPAESPIIRDGTISFATYGVITEPNGTAHVRLDLAEGDTLHLEVLVPDRPPENGLEDFSHLNLTVTAPDGSVTRLPGGSIIDRYDERFTDTAYLRTAELDAPAIAGTYELAITSAKPTRFTVATGRTEQFGTDVANYERQSLDAITTWYETPPPALSRTGTTAVPSVNGDGPPTTTAAPPPASVNTTLSPSNTTVIPSTESGSPALDVAAAPTATTDGATGGSVAVVIGVGLAALLATGWWLSRRRSGATDG